MAVENQVTVNEKTVTPVPISAYLLTFNNERTVEKALQSIRWVDEIVVVDSFSTDSTLDIVRRYTGKVIQRKWPGFRDQYQFASEQCANDWVLFIDADEEISPALAAEMKEMLSRNATRSPEGQTKGFHAHRRTYYLGRWHLHGGWLPDHEIRLYDRRFGRWEGGLHANVHIDGPEEHLNHFYYHYTYANISEQLATIDKYSTAALEDMKNAGRSFSVFRAVLNPIGRFFRDYVLKQGFRDGFPGLVVAVSTMFYVFIKYAKLWESQSGTPPFSDTADCP